MPKPIGKPTQQELELTPGTIMVRLIPDLSAAAFKQGKVNQLATWYCLRSLNSTGSGFIDMKKVIAGLQEHFGFSKSSAYVALGEGNGFWLTGLTKKRSTIRILGLLTVCTYLGTPLSRQRYFREVPDTSFNTPLKRRAEIYASFFKPAGIRANPISRAAIKEATGLQKVQQLRLERQAKIKKTPCFGVVYQGDGHHEVQPEKIEVTTKHETYLINKRLGNIYHTQQTAASHGMLKKVSRELKSLRSSETGEAPVGLIQRYFKSFRRLIRGLTARGEGLHEGYYLVNNADRLIRGRLEWSRYSVCA